VAAELVTAARSLGAPIVVGVLADDAGDVVDAIELEGVDRAVVVRVPSDRPRAEAWPHAIAALLDQTGAMTLLLPFSWDAAAAAATIAADRDLALVSDAVGLARSATGSLVVERAVYGGKLLARLEVAPGIAALVLLRPGVWPPAAAATSCPVENVALNAAPAARMRTVEVLAPAASADDLTRADVIFAVGRGIGDRENVPLFMEAARRCGASLGASRPLVDLGWLPRPQQVGQSGVTVKPRLYVAFGISGALQHLAGMKGARTIVAVNTDPDAPIFDAAHLASYVDAVEVARHLAADP
jgi:electron transfer flavoprotein alpha subunit